jgi:hypothetical protein
MLVGSYFRIEVLLPRFLSDQGTYVCEMSGYLFRLIGDQLYMHTFSRFYLLFHHNLISVFILVIVLYFLSQSEWLE